MNLQTLTKLFSKPAEADTSAALRKALAGIDVPKLEDVVSDLEAERKRILLSASREAIFDLDAKIRDANLDADRAQAAKEELQRRLEAAEAREAAEGLERQRAEAASLSAKAIAAIEALPNVFANIRATLRLVAEAEAAVATVNENLPADRHLVSPEAWRNAVSRGEEIISRKTVTLWAFAMNPAAPLDGRNAAMVQNLGGGRGRLPGPPAAEVVQRDFVRIEKRPASFGGSLSSLAESIALPAIKAGEVEHWPAARWADVLEHADRVEADLARGPVERPTVIVFEPIPERTAA